MNTNNLKNQIELLKGKNVLLKVNGLRNKTELISGLVDEIYSNVFIIKTESGTKSVSFVDLLTGDVELLTMCDNKY